MQSRGLEIVVGLFICLGIAAVFILTMRVSDLSDTGRVEGYTVTAAFSNVGGLKVGAPVQLAGVRVGRVSGIRIDETTYEAVVSMRIGRQYELPRDSDAQVLTAGLLGEQYIGIRPGAATENLTDGDEIKITQGAVILEDLIGQFLYRMGGQDDG